VAQSIRVTGGEQQNVRRDDLIAAETHKISHSDFFPESIHILLLLLDGKIEREHNGGQQRVPLEFSAET